MKELIKCTQSTRQQIFRNDLPGVMFKDSSLTSVVDKSPFVINIPLTEL